MRGGGGGHKHDDDDDDDDTPRLAATTLCAKQLVASLKRSLLPGQRMLSTTILWFVKLI